MKTLLVSFQLLFLVFASILSAENTEAAPAAEKKAENKTNQANQTNSTSQTQAGSSEAEKTLKAGLLAFPPSQQLPSFRSVKIFSIKNKLKSF